ncbi:ATP-binding cassette domain-containing protein [Allohahella marinimesophila]|uniref:ATP-binding cassette domain-containing protein n=2 Tax=Allohahella marinimesophila TaxID=1054972 RepID=A0ABP7PXW3_9GAMM
MSVLSQEHLVSIENMSFRRGDRLIFDNISLHAPRGKITGIMGPSGTGKTTLLKLIGGQIKPESGRVVFDDIVVNDMSRSRLYEMRTRMGMLFQSGALFSDLNVFENVAFPLRAHTALSNDMIRDIVLMKLNAVGLRGARDLMPSELSGGMARRAALARSIALDPDIIMYDEPFTGQDPIAMAVIVKLIRLLNDAVGLTTILVSHDIQETMSIADHLCIIADGKLMGQGSPEHLKTEGNEFVKQFLNGLPDGPVAFHYPAKDYKDDLLSVGGSDA